MKALSQLSQQIIQVAYDFRQLLVILLVVGISISFRMKGLIDGTNFTDIVKSTVISFFATRGAEHFANAWTTGQPTSPPPTEPSDNA